MRIIPQEYKIWHNTAPDALYTCKEIEAVLNEFGKDEWILIALQHNTYYFRREVKNYHDGYPLTK